MMPTHKLSGADTASCGHLRGTGDHRCRTAPVVARPVHSRTPAVRSAALGWARAATDGAQRGEGELRLVTPHLTCSQRSERPLIRKLGPVR